MITCLLATPALAQSDLPDCREGDRPTPGRVARVTLSAIDQPRPAARFGRRRLMVVPGPGRWQALVGVPLTLAPGRYIVTFDRNLDEQGTGERSFSVWPHRFRIVSRLPEPPASRREGRLPVLDVATLAPWREAEIADRRLWPPVDGRVVGRFAERVVEADGGITLRGHVLIRPRSGQEATVLSAPGRGRVARVERYRRLGATIVIDHGQGLASVVARAGDPRVAPGATVEPGTHIALRPPAVDPLAPPARESPEALPEPVYWALVLNGVRVDPFCFTGAAD